MIVRPWQPPDWLMWVLVAATIPVWGPIAAYAWLESNLRKVKRWFLGPRVGEWQRWFAWHPVALDNGFGPTVWLETVERQSLGTSYNYGICYRAIIFEGDTE